MSSSQHEIFVSSESDRFFERNKERLEAFDPAQDLPLRFVEMYQLRPRTVVEVGAANGFRVAALSASCGARAVAVEPSGKAVEDGRARFPAVEFVQADAAGIPIDETFDLAIVNFVFHWIDRSKLLRSVAEVDRLVADGGFLIIGDFYPGSKTKVAYHHLPNEEVYTYKQDYAAMFLASGLYRTVAMFTSQTGCTTLTTQTADTTRTGYWLLHKMLDPKDPSQSCP